jgi:formylglycine-generating enzyme required for sulfatase activity
MTIECVDGEKRACGTDVGECEKGQERCAGGKWSGVCEGGRNARAEVCNGKDDDCDGLIDNNARCSSGQVCIKGKCVKKSYGDEVGIRAGSFWMGSPENEPGRRSNERRRRVGLTRAFYMLRYEVTQGQFRRLMGYNPSFFSKCGANCPVEQVNWHEACAYANALSRSRGMEECYDCKGSGRGVRCDAKMQYRGSNYYNCSGYRLPTEAEWEYAARAGTSTAFYSGGITHTDCSPLDPNLDKIGWYCGNSESKTQHPVGRKQANAWGLYDMAGNVWEWVYDCYQDSYSGLTGKDPVNDRTGSERVLRGGSWYNFARYVRAAVRYERSPAYSDYDVGFRLLRSLSSN